MTTASETATATSDSSTPTDPSTTSAQESAGSTAAERPELAVGAAFAGGLLVALILKRLAG